jgi:hypothetical protein
VTQNSNKEAGFQMIMHWVSPLVVVVPEHPTDCSIDCRADDIKLERSAKEALTELSQGIQK